MPHQGRNELCGRTSKQQDQPLFSVQCLQLSDKSARSCQREFLEKCLQAGVWNQPPDDIARTEADNREQIDERGKICAQKQHQTPADFYRGYEWNCYEYRIDDQRDDDDPVDHVIVARAHFGLQLMPEPA